MGLEIPFFERTIMKQFHLALILFFLFGLIACAGGNAEKKSPEHLGSGTKALKKGIDKYQKGCYKNALDHFLKANEFFTAYDQQEGFSMSLNNM